MKPYEYVCIISFTNGLTSIAHGTSFEEIMQDIEIILKEHPKRTVAHTDIDVVFTSPRQRRGEA